MEIYLEEQKKENKMERMYSKTELGMLYFPDVPSKSVARRRIMLWIKRCHPLWLQLQQLGYQSGSQYFSPRMVKCIFEYLGEPGH